MRSRSAMLVMLSLAGCGNGVGTGLFGDRVRTIAAEYEQWGRVDDEVRWAPLLCRLPLPGVAHLSGSGDTATHGQKLYSVFARNRSGYPAGPHADQVVVKQSWTAERAEGVSFNPEGASRGAGADHFYPYAEKDGVVYRAAKRAGLYIMFKVDPATPDTDEGWVYATISPAGQVTASGRVASCMGCHAHAQHERLFGVPAVPILPARGAATPTR